MFDGSIIKNPIISWFTNSNNNNNNNNNKFVGEEVIQFLGRRFFLFDLQPKKVMPLFCFWKKGGRRRVPFVCVKFGLHICGFDNDVCVKGRPKKASMFGCTVVVVAVVVAVVQSPLMSSSKRCERRKVCFLNWAFSATATVWNIRGWFDLFNKYFSDWSFFQNFLFHSFKEKKKKVEKPCVSGI